MQKYGWHSKLAEKQNELLHVYKDENGSEVFVTSVSLSPINPESFFGDEVLVGPVEEWLGNKELSPLYPIMSTDSYKIKMSNL